MTHIIMRPQLSSCWSNPKHAWEKGTLLKEGWNVYILGKLREITSDVGYIFPRVISEGS